MTINVYHPLMENYRTSYDEKFWWIDPLIGAKISIPVTEKIYFLSEIDAGGLGVGSDYTWSHLSSINYTLTNNLSISAGYKAFKVNYNQKNHIYNILQSGPILGLTWQF